MTREAHARSREQCEAMVAGLSRLTGIDDYTILCSTSECKKQRLSYFVEQGRPAARPPGGPTGGLAGQPRPVARRHGRPLY